MNWLRKTLFYIVAILMLFIDGLLHDFTKALRAFALQKAKNKLK